MHFSVVDPNRVRRKLGRISAFMQGATYFGTKVASIFLCRRTGTPFFSTCEFLCLLSVTDSKQCAPPVTVYFGVQLSLQNRMQQTGPTPHARMHQRFPSSRESARFSAARGVARPSRSALAVPATWVGTMGMCLYVCVYVKRAASGRDREKQRPTVSAVRALFYDWRPAGGKGNPFVRYCRLRGVPCSVDGGGFPDARSARAIDQSNVWKDTEWGPNKRGENSPLFNPAGAC